MCKIQEYILSKQTTMRDYYYGGRINIDERNKEIMDCFLKEKEVFMSVLIRYEAHNVTYALISCPINPLPIKGEFQIPNKFVLLNYLEKEGWIVQSIARVLDMDPTHIQFIRK